MAEDTKPTLSVISTLYKSNAREIPAMLRKLADDIENPPQSDDPKQKSSNVNQAVCVIRDAATGQMNFYGWGDINIDNSISMLTIAKNEIAALAFKGRLWPIPQGGVAPKKE